MCDGCANAMLQAFLCSITQADWANLFGHSLQTHRTAYQGSCNVRIESTRQFQNHRSAHRLCCEQTAHGMDCYSSQNEPSLSICRLYHELFLQLDAQHHNRDEALLREFQRFEAVNSSVAVSQQFDSATPLRPMPLSASSQPATAVPPITTTAAADNAVLSTTIIAPVLSSTTVATTVLEPWVEECIDDSFRLLLPPDADHSVRLRPSQRAAITAAIAGKDVLLVIPTGGGKTAVYSVPAMIQCRSSSTTVVIVPTLALMYDAMRRLKQAGQTVLQLNSTESIDVGCIQRSPPRFLFSTPESLRVDSVRTALLQLASARQIDRIVFDEAHTCLTDRFFRPAMDRVHEGATTAISACHLTSPGRRSLMSVGCLNSDVPGAGDDLDSDVAFLGDRYSTHTIWIALNTTLSRFARASGELLASKFELRSSGSRSWRKRRWCFATGR